MSFRQLLCEGFGHPTKSEGRILLARHYRHGTDGSIRNQLTPGEPELAQKRGRALKLMLEADGIKISGAISSTQPRCITSLIETMVGMGHLLQIDTDCNLGDLAVDPIVDISFVDQEQKRLGLPTGETTFLSLDVDSELQANVYERGMRGREALLSWARFYAGETILVFSHSGGRIEQTILALKNPTAKNRAELGEPQQIFKTGQMVELIINLTTGTLVEENYLEI